MVYRSLCLTISQVLQGLQGKGYLDTQVVVQIQDVIKERETTADELELTSPTANGDTDMAESHAAAAPAPAASSQPPPRSARKGGPHRLDKRQVEQRIEEDRERHKRERENIWAVPGGADAEMTKLWEETSDFGEDDDRLIKEEEADFQKAMEMQRCHHKRGTANGGSTA